MATQQHIQVIRSYIPDFCLGCYQSDTENGVVYLLLKDSKLLYDIRQKTANKQTLMHWQTTFYRTLTTSPVYSAHPIHLNPRCLPLWPSYIRRFPRHYYARTLMQWHKNSLSPNRPQIQVGRLVERQDRLFIIRTATVSIPVPVN
jgi:hypothetical protein